MKKRILIYNWIRFDEQENKGGGVTVYTKNLIETLLQEERYEIIFLSSGRAYDSRRKEIYVERTGNIFGSKCKSYQIVNSPVLSSAHLSFPYPQDLLEDIDLKKIVKEFLLSISGVDVIHFQNMEGLSLSVLELKEDFPDTKFIYTLHNYYPFCPQVMLWQNDNNNCKEKGTGKACINCMPQDVFKEKVVFNQQLQFDKEHHISASEDKIKQKREMEERISRNIENKIYDDRNMKRLEELFSIYREKNVKYFNRYIDKMLCVSGRVAELALKFGILEEKIITNYIGTKVADSQKEYVANNYQNGLFTICYLGYVRRNKGFYFLMDALEAISPDVSKKIRIVLGTPIESEAVQKRIRLLKESYADIIIYPGYTHDELPNILKDVNLGVVPPLWEDNLPQVAIEMKANGIPVLCSDIGGAKELSAADGFVFEAGNIEDFKLKLLDIVNGNKSLDSYFEKGMKLVTMKEHIAFLKELY